MENPEAYLKIPNQLCQEIFNCQFELDIGNISQQMVSRTIQLYSQAMSYFITLKTQTAAVKKRIVFYQDKIKRLLTRKDIQLCLVGKKVNPRSIDIQHQLQKIRQSAPEQAKALIQYYKAQHLNQQLMIKKTVDEQNSRLNQRIQRRSKSKSLRCDSPSKFMIRSRLVTASSLRSFQQ